MKCPKCKKELRENAKFCTACGARVEKKRGIRFTSILLVVSILLGIVVIGCGGGILFARFFGSSSENPFSGKTSLEIHNTDYKKPLIVESTDQSTTAPSNSSNEPNSIGVSFVPGTYAQEGSAYNTLTIHEVAGRALEFTASWYRIGDVSNASAMLDGNTASFDYTSPNGNWRVAGTLHSPSENSIVLTISDSTFEYIDVGEYRYSLSDRGFLEEEEPDQVIDYHPTEAHLVIPSNLPSDIAPEWLEKLVDVHLDGYWYSLDGRYVYQIYGTEYPTIGNTLRFVDMEDSDEVKSGKVVQTSDYSIILKANEDGEFRPEVFTADGMLQGEEVDLYRTDIIRASWLLGTWKNDDVTYEFDSDGVYHVDGKRRSYWGYYFLIGKDQIVLSEQNEDCELMEYTIDDNTLVLDGSIALRR